MNMSMNVCEVMWVTGLAQSKSEAKRLVAQGAVEVDGIRITDATVPAPYGVWHVGERKWLEIVPECEVENKWQQRFQIQSWDIAVTSVDYIEG